MKSYTVTPASRAEAFAILSEPQIARQLDASVDTVLDEDYLRYILRYGEYRLLFLIHAVGMVGEGTLEIHIGCPKSDIVASRTLALLVMHWLIKDSCSGTHTLLTSTRSKLIANFILKLGFTSYVPHNEPASDMRYFKYTVR